MAEPYVIKTYNHLHTIPEKALCEVETSKFIASELKEMGFTFRRGVEGTMVVAELDSGNPGPVLAVRADMDALEFCIDGKAKMIHACGHDANSSMVLAAAKRVSKLAISKGKVVFVFQPAEETGQGALLVSKTQVLSDVDEMIGIHLRPMGEAEMGQATPALCHGASKMMEFKITGSATHGARQHLGVNAVDAAAMAVMAVNTVHVNPSIPHSAKVTNLQTGGSAFNIIPETVHMKLDLRAQTNEAMETLTQKIERAITTSVQSMGAQAEMVYSQGLPGSNYDDDMVKAAEQAITEVLGQSMAPIVTPGGEDFHYYQQMQDIKTAYIGLGADLVPGLHKPDMHFELKALHHGEEILTKIIENKLA